MKINRTFSIAAISFLLLFVACSKGSPPPAQSNSSSNANGNAAAQNPALLPTLRGDLERIGVALFAARDLVKNNRWEAASEQLQAAKGEVETALSRNPRLRDSWEDLRNALNKAAATIENRGKDADAQLMTAQQIVGALKVQTPG